VRISLETVTTGIVVVPIHIVAVTIVIVITTILSAEAILPNRFTQKKETLSKLQFSDDNYHLVTTTKLIIMVTRK